MDGMDVEPESSEGSVLVEDLLARCQGLLDELHSFQTFLEEARRSSNGRAEHAVDIKQFHGLVNTEMQSLQKLSAGDPNAEKTIHTLKSSNFPFYSAIWEAAKRSEALVGFHRRFYWDERQTNGTKSSTQMHKRGALVDFVAYDGDEWVKLSTTSEERLLFELAKARWEVADSSDEDEGSDNDADSDGDEDELGRMELVRIAHNLKQASQANRIHYEYPRVRFVLPKLSNPPPVELVPLLERIQSSGALIELGGDSVHTTNSQHLEADLFPRLLPSVHPPLTNTLNVDCTILLALVSDLSYVANHPIQANYNAAIRRQIEVEANEHLLPTYLWPGMADRDLVCTAEAAKRMREIVDTIGMPNERIRTELVMEDGSLGPEAGPFARQPHALRESLQKFSDYEVPSSFRLPIRIRSAPSASDVRHTIGSSRLPAVAMRVADELTPINRSVFMFGWLHGFTTVSSNRTIAKAIESTIEKHGNGDKGPEIWLREPARSLLGKEKVRRK